MPRLSLVAYFALMTVTSTPTYTEGHTDSRGGTYISNHHCQKQLPATMRSSATHKLPAHSVTQHPAPRGAGCWVTLCAGSR
ncbi:MAG TPA: hypothetical protein VKR06_30515 [Ktedonosporobacter sp.]|nr:hypothetical protein [Ktedonosporobacter sp.]